MIALVETPPIGEWVRALAVSAGVVLILVAARRVLDSRTKAGNPLGFGPQLAMLALSLVGLIAVVLALPLEVGTRGQLLSFLGILLSAAIALSSTTLLGNAMAGLTLRAVRSFRVGDFIRVEGHFGRVTERGLVHTEIQTEDRDLTTLPNLFLATHPVRVVRSSGTVISAKVSLGYDVPHGEVERLLRAAAVETGLEEPFVQVVELGDFSVTYRTAGLLRDVLHMVSTRSHLRTTMLDRLHGGGIEIVSPTFMNTRSPGQDPVIPERSVASPEKSSPESMIFDKAEEATSLEKMRERLAALDAEIAGAPGDAGTAERLAALGERRARLAETIEEMAQRQREED